jgi:hypothetical protein
MTTYQYTQTKFTDSHTAIVDWYYLKSLQPVLMIDTTDLGTADQAAALIAASSRHSLMLCNNSRTNIVKFNNVVASTTAALAALTTITLGSNTETATAVNGINLQMDAANTDNTGIQIDCGIDAASPAAITVGTDTGGYIEATFFTSNWTKHDAVVIGFRKIEVDGNNVPTFQTTFGGIAAGASGDPVYTDVAVFGMMGTADKLQTMTDLNDSGASVVTDTTNLAVVNENLKLRVSVSSTGAVTYKYSVNNVATDTSTLAAPSTTAAFTFDTPDIIIPFITVQNNNHDTPLYLKQLSIVKYA